MKSIFKRIKESFNNARSSKDVPPAKTNRIPKPPIQPKCCDCFFKYYDHVRLKNFESQIEKEIFKDFTTRNINSDPPLGSKPNEPKKQC
jgi:hypothetical protein